MRQFALQSTLSLVSDCADDASTRQSSLDTTLPSTSQSSSSSVTSSTRNLPPRERRSSLKLGLKASKSAPSLTVRFELPELPKMTYGESHAAQAPQEYRTLHSANTPKRRSANAAAQNLSRPPLSKKLSKRLSAPAPISRKEVNPTSETPLPQDFRNSSAPASSLRTRVTSFQSTASAPAVLVSTPLSPSQPPSQYNPLQHYVPCIIKNCPRFYSPSHFGPTFYTTQQPYQLSRKRALCPWHANEDLKLANHKAKCMWESMRQNAGRKTLGLVAAEFEIYVQQCREDRALESDELEARQKKKVLGVAQSNVKSKERADAGQDWDWKYTPRPCTMKGCSKQWYSPFDNRLFLFYHTKRPSGLQPLTTLCPSCARSDVEIAEERIKDRRSDAGAGPEWVEWCGQVQNDRRMEEEYWMQAQERVVREKGVSAVVAVRKEKVGGKEGITGKERKKKSEILKGICVVM